jgi:hypothetical protein
MSESSPSGLAHLPRQALKWLQLNSAGARLYTFDAGIDAFSTAIVGSPR